MPGPRPTASRTRDPHQQSRGRPQRKRRRRIMRPRPLLPSPTCWRLLPRRVTLHVMSANQRFSRPTIVHNCHPQLRNMARTHPLPIANQEPARQINGRRRSPRTYRARLAKPKPPDRHGKCHGCIMIPVFVLKEPTVTINVANTPALSILCQCLRSRVFRKQADLKAPARDDRYDLEAIAEVSAVASLGTPKPMLRIFIGVEGDAVSAVSHYYWWVRANCKLPCCGHRSRLFAMREIRMPPRQLTRRMKQGRHRCMTVRPH
jgi:hypothetical protein